MSIDEHFNALVALLKAEKAALEDEKAAWKGLEPKLKISNLSDPIILNVGGIHFALTLKALTSKPGSFFSAMFSGRWEAKTDKNGVFFIDRNPSVFNYVADHLRGRKVNVTLLTPMEKELLKDDADYYQLGELAELLKPKHIKGDLAFVASTDINPNNYITFSENRRKATKSSGRDSWNSTVVGPEFVWPETDFAEVRARHTFRSSSGSCTDAMVGLASSQAIIAAARAGSAPYGITGWYLYTNNGALFSQSGENSKAYANKPVANEAVVGVRLHSDGRVSFAVDGTDYGTAFTVPTNQKYRFAIMTYRENTCFELLE